MIVKSSSVHKKRKKKSSEQERDAEVEGDTVVGVSEPTLPPSTDVAFEKRPTIVNVMGGNAKYVPPQQRSLSKNELVEHSQIRKHIRGLLNKLSESNIEAITKEMSAISHVLLPLVNIPMIDYTLAWLESAGIEEVFVFCFAHSKQVTSYLDNSKWFGQPNFSITTIESHNSVSAGDALCLIYERNVIHGDFVLVSGDTVSNMSLTEALQEHKERWRKYANAVMTMVVKQSKPSLVTRQSRIGTDELIMAIDPDTKQLLYSEDKAEHIKGTVSLDRTLLADILSISLHNDKQEHLSGTEGVFNMLRSGDQLKTLHLGQNLSFPNDRSQRKVRRKRD